MLTLKCLQNIEVEMGFQKIKANMGDQSSAASARFIKYTYIVLYGGRVVV